MAAPIIAASAVKGLTENKYTPLVLGGIILTVGLVGYFGIYRPLGKKLGFVKTKDDKAADKLEDLSFFNPEIAKSHPSRVTISENRANTLAKIIYDSDGWFNDDEDNVNGAFREMGSKYNLSYVSQVFINRYNKDMHTYISKFLDSDELSDVYTIIKNY